MKSEVILGLLSIGTMAAVVGYGETQSFSARHAEDVDQAFQTALETHAESIELTSSGGANSTPELESSGVAMPSRATTRRRTTPHR